MQKVKIIDHSPVFHNKTGVIFQKMLCDVPDNQWWYKIKFDDSNLSSYTFLKHEFITI